MTKCDNNMICDSINPVSTSSQFAHFRVLIIHFGKATTVELGRTYNLSPVEITEYTRLYSHVAPEVIEGKTSQSRNSDIYSLALVENTHFLSVISKV